MINVAVAGYGYWGPNIVRTFSQLHGVRLVRLADQDQAALKKARRLYPGLRTGHDLDAIIKDPEVDAVAVALPTELHYNAARRALAAGKHVFVEKPLCLTSAQAQRLVSLAQDKQRTLMVGHLLMYHPGVARLKKMVSSGHLGNIRYIYAQRLNLGMIRSGENALQSLAPHDFSVILFLLDEMPVSVSAMGQAYIQPHVEDTVFVHLTFANSRMAHLHVSWLDPHKIRRITVVGDKKMAVFDDMHPSEKLRVFDKGVEPAHAFTNYGEVLSLRFGDINSPRLDTTEPLRLELQHFVDCVRRNRAPLSGGHNGADVVRVLEAAQKSLKNNGRIVRIKST